MIQLLYIICLALGYFASGLTAAQEKDNRFVLITFLYNENNVSRRNEYLTCFSNNFNNPSIEIIHVIYDTSQDDKKNNLLSSIKNKMEQGSKVVNISYIKGRPSYGDCFEIANNWYPYRNIIVTNGDIYFNNTLELLYEYDLTDTFVALTRWNIQQNGKIVPYYGSKGEKVEHSQDSWIFKSPIAKLYDADIKLGTQHCDGRIAYEANRIHLKVINPCLSLQAIHLHLSNLRHWKWEPDPKVNKMGVPWSTLGAEKVDNKVK